MKTLSTAILFGLAIGVAHTAAAEPFNHRGPDWLQTVSPSKHAPVSAAGNYPVTLGFNDKTAGWDWVAKVSPSTSIQKPSQCPLDDLLATHSIGFNEKYNIQC